MDVDLVFSKIGDFGFQQAIYVLVLSLCRLYAATTIMAYVFLKRDIPFVFTLVNGTTLKEGQCRDEQDQSCAAFTFNTTNATSIASEWNLVCNREWMLPLSFSARLTGSIIGVFLTGCLSDKMGRKFSLVASLSTVIIVNQLGAITQWYHFYVICQVIMGLSIIEVPLSVLANEMAGKSKRNVVVIIFSLGWSFGLVVLSILAYFIATWRYLVTSTTAVGIFALILVILLVPESPRWLHSKQRDEEASKVLRKIAKGNGTLSVIDDDTTILRSNTKEQLLENKGFSVKPMKTVKFQDLFKHAYTILILAILIYIWGVTNILYNGLVLLAGTDGGNIYIATAVSGLVDIPGDLIGVIFVKYLGRKKVIFGAFIITGLLLSTIFVFDPSPAIIVVCLSVSKMGASLSYAILTVYTNELFPTSARGTTFGFIMCLSKACGIFTPYLVLIGQYYHQLEYILLGTMSILAGSLTLLILPETSGQSMPESIEDMLRRKPKCFH